MAKEGEKPLMEILKPKIPHIRFGTSVIIFIGITFIVPLFGKKKE
jgi:hypothetical protein